MPGTVASATVLKRYLSRLPAVPLPAASKSVPSAALIVDPSTVTVMVEAPGMGFRKKSQA